MGTVIIRFHFLWLMNNVVRFNITFENHEITCDLFLRLEDKYDWTILSSEKHNMPIFGRIIWFSIDELFSNIRRSGMHIEQKNVVIYKTIHSSLTATVRQVMISINPSKTDLLIIDLNLRHAPCLFALMKAN